MPINRTAVEIIYWSKPSKQSIDTWLIYKLTGKFYTDVTNASRTLLFNIETLQWNENILSKFNIPIDVLAEVKPSLSNSHVSPEYLKLKISLNGTTIVIVDNKGNKKLKNNNNHFKE